jgi:hypothetical protein
MVGDEVRAHEGSAETRSIMDAASSDSGAATEPVSLGRGNTGSMGSRWRERQDLRKLNANGRTTGEVPQLSIEGGLHLGLWQCPWMCPSVFVIGYIYIP